MGRDRRVQGLPRRQVHRGRGADDVAPPHLAHRRGEASAIGLVLGAVEGMKLWVLGSGSGGNAVLVECGGSRVLVDAGFAPRTLAARLQAIGIAPASIEACVVTHEHTDHVKGAAAGARKWGW